MSQELYKLLPFLKPISESAKTTAEQRAQARQRKSSEQIRQGGELSGQTKTKELYKLLPFLQPAKTSNFTSGLESDKITVDGVTYDMRLPEHKKQMNLAIDAIQAKQKPIYESDDAPIVPPSPITDQRNSDYLSARKALTTDSSTADIKKVEDKGMTAWAKANKGLAAMVKPGQSGYDQSQDVLGNSTQDQRDLASDMGVMGVNPEERMARAKGGIVEVDIDGSGVGAARINPQGFKDDAQMALINTLNKENITPIVKGIKMPDMSKYAGIFNQTDTTDYNYMMENAAMTQLAENIGLPVNTYNTGNYFDRMFGK